MMQIMSRPSGRRGFTLIELLIVIAIIAILAVTVFVALNPARRFSEARNSRRWSDINSMLTAIHQCIVDSDGSLEDCGITNDGVRRALYEGELDLSSELEPYLKSIPLDPQDDGNDGCYSLDADDNNLITIYAECAELDEEIMVSR